MGGPGPGTRRVYADTPDAPFATRLERAVRACEDAVARDGDHERRPDVVLLDSRAGIHDIAAVAISRICDLALLFGSDNAQTWSGYKVLGDTMSPYSEVRYAGIRLAECLSDALRIAESRGMRLPYQPDRDEDTTDGHTSEVGTSPG